MYGYLVWKEDNSIDTIFINWLSYAKMRAASQEHQTQLENAAWEVFKKVCPAKDPLYKQLRPDDVKKLFFRVAPEHQSYGIGLWLAHQRLPEVLRKARTAAIDQAIAEHFGDLVQMDELQGLISNLKSLAVLVADDLMEIDVRDQSAILMSTFLASTAVFKTALEPVMTAIMRTVQHQTADRFNAIKDLVWMLTCTRAAGQREQVLNQLLALMTQSRSQLLLDASARAQKLATPLPAPMFHDALSEMVADALTTDAGSDQAIIEARLNMAIERYTARKNRATAATMEAAAAGVFMGDKTPGNQEAIIRFDRERNLLNRKRTRDCLRRARERKGGTPLQASPAQQAETAVLQAWPVQQLAQWIEGPITDRRKGAGGIDRKAILLKDQRPQVPQAGKPTGQKAPAPDELTLDDVNSTILQALSATADFFLAEIGDLAALATQLKTHPELVAGCTSLLEPLQRLAAPAKPPMEDEATALLAKAEAAILELRTGLKSAESAAKLQSRFPDALIAALRAESLELGKRHGGQIGCRARAEDWTFVCDNFHNRWLPQVRSILINGLPMQLPTNQAVALYVTGSSQSGYAFDVSVHLWQRRLGKQTLPGAGNDLYPPMNQDDWFDTHVPCCVLHVPSAE